MNKVLKMLTLDFSLIKPYSKSLLIAFLAPLVVLYTTKDFVSGLVVCMSILAMTSNYTFSVAEKNDLNRLYGLIPVTKKDIVNGRYLFTALTGVFAVICVTILNTLIMTVSKISFSIEDLIVALSVGLGIYMFFTAIQLPGFFKFGAIKGRFISFIPFLGMILVSAIAQGLNPESLDKLPDIAVLNNPYSLLVISVLLDIIFYGISIGISQRIYDRMEL